MKIKKGDKVKILLGKDRGKTGEVDHVLAKDNRVYVAGANLYKRHVKKMEGMEGGIINIPKPMDISNVGLICPNCKKVTRIGYKTVENKKIRFCRKCQKEIIKNETKK